MAYYVNPYSSPYLSPISTISSITPTSPFSLYSPVSKITVTPYSTTVLSTNYLAPLTTAVLDYDTGLNDSYMVQKEATEWLWHRILGKWLWKDEMCGLLKYLKVENGVAKPISSKDDYKGNKICNDKIEDVEAKVQWIEDHIFGISEMRKVLQKMIAELGYRWVEFTSKESVVVEATERYLRKKLKSRIGQ